MKLLPGALGLELTFSRSWLGRKGLQHWGDAGTALLLQLLCLTSAPTFTPCQ